MNAKELQDFNLEFDMLERVYCTKEDEKVYRLQKKNKLPLPDGVFYDEEQDRYYTVTEQYEVDICVKYQAL